MEKMLLNKSMVRKNKSLKMAKKAAKKECGKAPKSDIKNCLGKLVVCDSTESADANTYKTIEVELDNFMSLLETSNLKGKSGSGFSVYSKIKTYLESQTAEKFIIINGAECEPGLIHDQWLIKNHFNKIIAGVRSLSKILPASKIIFAAKLFPAEVSLNKSFEGIDSKVTKIFYQKLPAKYPMGEEHILIKQTIGMDFPKKNIPAERGILILNVQTVFAIYNLLSGESEKGQYVTLADLDKGIAIPAFVKPDEKIKDRLIKAFGKRNEYWAGSGIMNAFEVSDQTFNDLISFACVAEKTASNTNKNKCKGCGACQKKCPANVQLKKIVSIKEKNPDGDISGLGAEKCLHCRNCSFICAAQKDVMTYCL